MNTYPINKDQITPILSIVMPVFNSEKYLRAAINSILTQTFQDFEFIIINDGSTDKSQSIIDSYKDKRIIREINSSNQGIVSALNIGLEKARGKYIARMDADDISLPKRMELQFDFLENNQDHVCVGTYIQLVDPELWPITITKPPLTHQEVDNLLMLGNSRALIHGTAMMKTETVNLIGYYRPEHQFAEDFDFNLRLSEAGKLANIPVVLYKYRQHPLSINHQQWQKWQEIKSRILSDAYHRRDIKMNWEHKETGPIPQSDYRFQWARSAYAARYFHSLLKNLTLSIINNGLKKEHYNFIAYILKDIYKKIFANN